jgi:4-carboxymuconolactone decarboxylase
VGMTTCIFSELRISFSKLRTCCRTRSAIWGQPHRAVAATTPFTEPFQDYITRCAWGEIWSRPGLSRAERSIVTLSVLAALQHEQELALHVRAALRNGLRVEQIREVLLQVALYAGVPAGNRAFAIAQRILAEDPPRGHQLRIWSRPDQAVR